MRHRNLPHQIRYRLDVQRARIPSDDIRPQLEHGTFHCARISIDWSGNARHKSDYSVGNFVPLLPITSVTGRC